MMKKSILLLLLAWALASCGGGQATQSACQVEVELGFPAYTVACLKSADGQMLDTLAVTDGHMAFVRTDSTRMPYVALLHLQNPQDSTDTMDMPFVVEGGTVSLRIGEYIHTTGTPLNQRMQHFLDDLQATITAVRETEHITVDDLRRTYSEFYRHAMLDNRHNVVGRYIYSAYRIHLLPDDFELVKAEMENQTK